MSVVPEAEAPPPVRLYPEASWAPKSIHQLIAPHAGRLPFERAWRNPNRTGGWRLQRTEMVTSPA